MYLTWRHETGRIIARFTDRVYRRLFWLTLTRALTSKSLKSPLVMPYFNIHFPGSHAQSIRENVLIVGSGLLSVKCDDQSVDAGESMMPV